jgi:RNA polymerase sigma-70 factor (ECF subfamily)
LLRATDEERPCAGDDLAQDTFLQVYRSLRQFRGDARFATWIYRIAYNTFLAHVRSAHRKRRFRSSCPTIHRDRPCPMQVR